MSHESGGTIGFIHYDENEKIIEDIQEYCTERSIGTFDSMKIEVFDDEGMFQPHFHLTNSNKTVDCCISLLHPRFFPHGTHTKECKKPVIKDLNKWLHQGCQQFTARGKLNDWEFVVASYSPSGEYFKEGIHQPDYLEIDNNPFDMEYKLKVGKRIQIKGVNGYECVKDNTDDIQYILLTENNLHDMVNVRLVYLIEDNFSNDEVYVCQEVNDKRKYDNLDSVTRLIGKKYIRPGMARYISEREYNKLVK